MNWLDVVIVLIILAFLFLGLVKGLVVILFGLAGLAVGIKLGWVLYLPVSGKLGFIQNAVAAKVVAFAVILLAVLIVSWIVRSIVKNLVSKVGLGYLDHLGGAILGLVVGIFLSVVLVTVLLWIPLSSLSETVYHSKLAVFLMERLDFFFSMPPGDGVPNPSATAFLK